jgi:hypothetical protein
VAFSDLVELADGVVLQALGGNPVRYSPRPSGPYLNVTGVFEAQYRRAEVLEGSATLSVPAVFLRESALLPNDPATDDEPTVTIGSTTYRVRETRKDGLGGMVLMLQELGL